MPSLTHIPHADERYSQRYGLNLTEEDYKKILSRIKKGEAQLIVDQKDRHVYKMEWDHKEIRLVVDPHTQTVITFLPNGFSAKENRTRSENVIVPHQIWKLKTPVENFPKEIIIVRKDPLGDTWFVKNTKSHKDERMIEESIKKYYKFKKVQ